MSIKAVYLYSKKLKSTAIASYIKAAIFLKVCLYLYIKL